jgi:hypothetical protein
LVDFLFLLSFNFKQGLDAIMGCCPGRVHLTLCASQSNLLALFLPVSLKVGDGAGGSTERQWASDLHVFALFQVLAVARVFELGLTLVTCEQELVQHV